MGRGEPDLSKSGQYTRRGTGEGSTKMEQKPVVSLSANTESSPQMGARYQDQELRAAGVCGALPACQSRVTRFPFNISFNSIITL